MAAFLLVRHTVKDFATWKAGYDTHLPKRQEAGLIEHRLLRGADDPNDVVLLFEARDLERARAFAASDELRERMRSLGVQGRPELCFLRDQGT